MTVPPSRRALEASEELYHDDLAESYVDDDPAPSRRNRWLSWLFWAGTALAPIAALLLVMGQGVNPLRAAAALAILGVVCIGLSVTLRDSSSAAHAELAEDLQREVNEVRSELETLRRGVQLTVNRELGRVRGELEAAQQVLRTEATRLPVSTGRARSPEPNVTAAAVRSPARPAAPARNNLPDRRAAAIAEPTGEVPVAAVPNARSRETDRADVYPSYDPTASHPIVTQAPTRRPLSDPYIVEPIREKYSSTPVPTQRTSSSDSPAFSYADMGRDSYDSADKWSWATSTSTQDWQPDFDLPSLDGLPMPGYAESPAPDSYSNGRSGSVSRFQASNAPAPAAVSAWSYGGGRHSSDDSDASWYRG